MTSNVVTWYNEHLDMYVTQDENGNLTYTSVAEHNNLESNASTVTKVDSKTFKRLTRNIFALVNGKVIYLENTPLFHAEMIANYLNHPNDDKAWNMIVDIDRGYIDYDKRYLDIYQGHGKIIPNLENTATIILTLLTNKMITNDYLLYFCGGTYGITSIGRFLVDYELKTRE